MSCNSEANTPQPICPNCGSTLFCIVEPHASSFSDSDPIAALVQCSQCDKRFFVDDAGGIERLQVHDTSALSSETLSPGDVLRLSVNLDEIPAGLYMVINIGFLIELARCAENEDGDLASTHRIVKVTHHEIGRFEHTYLTIPTTL